MTLSRRTFLKAVAGAVALMLPARAARAHDRPDHVLGLLAEETLDPASLPKFVTPLFIPPAMPRAGKVTDEDGKRLDAYEIAVRQFEQQILPAGYPATAVWGYGAAAAEHGPALFHYPAATIEARHGAPLRIRWINDLVDADGAYLPHLLPVDQTLHWCNPPGGTVGRDTRPAHADTPGPYSGPVPIVTHVHGHEGVGDESDGYPEAWFLPAATNLPAGYADRGAWYDFFAAKAEGLQGAPWTPGSTTGHYPNSQRPATLWYHDHALGLTRLNVYAGPVGFYLVRGGTGDRLLDRRTGRRARLPRPAPGPNDRPGTRYYEIPLVIQDRAFNADGSLFYPDTRAFFDGIPGSYVPHTDIPPAWNPEFFGDCMVVNGNTWPNLDVEQRRYRFRLLNACGSRFLILNFNTIPGAKVWMIGGDGGYLAAPIDMADAGGELVLLAPAERADLIVDFSAVPEGRYVLGNLGPDEPYGGGVPGRDFESADPVTTGRVMQFTVGPARAPDVTTPPEFLQLPPVERLEGGATRRLALLEVMSRFFEDAPSAAVLGTLDGDLAPGAWGRPLFWHDPATETPEVGATEVWEIYNLTEDAHPIHIHAVFFQVVDRRRILVVDEEAGLIQDDPNASALPAEPWESGWKDTVIAYPATVTRLRMAFANPGQFVWHCHVLEHEDNEMMRPYRIGPEQPGRPGSHRHA